jgi:DNA polymerase-4
LRTIRDVAAASPAMLEQAAGSSAGQLRAFALGIDDRPVEVERDDAKSYGVQDTFSENVSDRETILATLRTMADGLMARVREDHKAIRTVTVKVRYPDFTDESHAATLPEATDLETDIYPRLPALLRGAWKRAEPLRLVSLRFSNVCEPIYQAELPLDAGAVSRSRQKKAAALLDQLRARDLPLTRGHALRPK